MVKSNSLSSDLDLVKEIEELRIKQKLLIESLRQKNLSDENKLFLEINSKLDFLVKIFTQANKNDDVLEDENQQITDKKLVDLDEKLNNMQEEFIKRFDNLEKNILKIKCDCEDLENSKNDFKMNLFQKNDLNLPPKPNFVVEDKKKEENKF